MSDDELGDALEGLYAYDQGATDSGIHDEALREKCKARLQTVEGLWLARWARDHFLSERALDQGYRLEDVRGFIEWLSDRMDCDI